MERIKQLIEEIRELGSDRTHRSALRIYNLLENNRKLFLEKLDQKDLDLVIATFNTIANKSPVEYNTTAYKDDFERSYQTLLFYLNRII